MAANNFLGRFSLDILSEDSVLYENIRKASSVILDYGKNNKEMVYGGLGLVVCTVVSARYGPDLRHRFFAWLNDKAVKMKQEDYEVLRKGLFAPLATHKSHDPELRKANSVRILEIGVGVGNNFSHYPPGSHLVVVDPNPHFASYYNENRANFPNIKSDSVIVSTGEDMDMVADESVDVVVTTVVLCSVQDIAKVISQIKRVLVPGGKYFFMEHVQEWDRKNHRLRWLMQHIVSLFLWPFMFDGCRTNRNPLPAMNAVGFSDITMDRIYAPVPMKILTLVSPHVIGVATK